MSKVALITGITGQDGSYLAELLLTKGYEVHGIVRRVALEDKTHRVWRIRNILDDITLHSASLESYASLFKIVQKIKPDEVYHLAAQSYVTYSFEDEFSTLNININGTHYLLSAAKEFASRAIRVNAIAPGIVRTPFWDKLDDEFAQIFGNNPGDRWNEIAENVVLGRPGVAEDVVPMAIFLAGSGSDYITGQTYNVLGGIIMS